MKHNFVQKGNSIKKEEAAVWADDYFVCRIKIIFLVFESGIQEVVSTSFDLRRFPKRSGYLNCL